MTLSHICNIAPPLSRIFKLSIKRPGRSFTYSLITVRERKKLMMQTSTLILVVMTLVSPSGRTLGNSPCYCNVVVQKGCDGDAYTSDLPQDCTEIRNNDDLAVSGKYMINPDDGGEAFRVYCDMDTDGGGWTVFQRREDGSLNFYRGWAEYKKGFGNVNSEHWLGNDKIHRISSAGNYELRIDMSSFESETRYAQYENFRIGDELSNYKLVFEAYSGDAGDSLSSQHNNEFSTSDQDNDVYDLSCAKQFSGAWWYSDCHSSNLNGLYLRGATDQYATGVTWSSWKGQYYSLKTTEMKIRKI